MHSSRDSKTPDPISPELLEAALELWGQAEEPHLIPISGKSMLPLLREGDLVLVAHTREVQPGEIAVFLHSGGLVAHRVLAVFGEGESQVLRAKGDNTLGVDPPINTDEIVGKVVARRRDGKQIDLLSPSWRQVGRVAGAWSKAQAWIYYRGSGLEYRAQLNPPSVLSIWVSRVLRFSLNIFLRICNIILARQR